MTRFLEGKFAVVTGGARGIGRAITESLLDAGASVAICSKSGKSLEKAVAELEGRGTVIGRPVDVSHAKEVTEFFTFIETKFPRIDVLVNNAGVGIFRNISDMTVEEWQRTIDTNLSGAFYCSHEALARFRKHNGGYIINISSLAGKNPFAGGGAYNASKFGLNGFSEAMMLDHRQQNVRVSYIMPGSVATEFGSGGGEDWKIAPKDIASLVITLLQMPERTLVSRLEVRPSRPKGK